MQQKILLVDDDLGAIKLMRYMLAGLGDVQFATNGADALRLVSEAPPSVIVLDAEMPGMSGFEVCRAVKADPATADVPIIFVTSHAEVDLELEGFALGAADFIAKPVRPALLQARVKTQLRLSQLTQELRQIAATDGLTQLANRRKFDESLLQEWQRCQRSGTALSMLLVDVDHFKQFNDRYGHPAGDDCLRQVAQALRDAGLRLGDLAARYGGEEFALLMPQTDRAGAAFVARRIMENVAALRIEHGDSAAAGRLSVSIGIASCDEYSADWLPSRGEHGEASMREQADRLVRSADQALYAAKQAGRARAYQGHVSDTAPGSAPVLAVPPLSLLASATGPGPRPGTDR
ncbi:diguanylate cyclase [Paracidovorax anthurii]|uniref:diguanylate cyclase n=1 Tax=Paracidovorax anthurii TaxID=78229 RepID=A0A328YSC1_9BURK|nr:diguanylate cyclase [Paracidovorax anthurii]RAR76739.1 response regulator receiver modulated diguanylate cyclase [Paracidovorax anthurii]